MLNYFGFFERERNPFGLFDNDFVDNGDGTVTDRRTGLMWQKEGSRKSLTLRRAKTYVEELNKDKFAGHSDWRLPSIEELASLMNKNRTNGLHIDPLFSNRQKESWSSREFEGSNPNYQVALLASFESGKILVGYWQKTFASHGKKDENANNYVRVVRSVHQQP